MASQRLGAPETLGYIFSSLACDSEARGLTSVSLASAQHLARASGCSIALSIVPYGETEQRHLDSPSSYKAHDITTDIS